VTNAPHGVHLSPRELTVNHSDATTTSGLQLPDVVRRWLPLALFIGAAFAAGAIGSLIQGDDVAGRYLALERPVWAPPRQAFGIVWPVLYLLIGIAGWRASRGAGSLAAASSALTLWGAQLVVNAAWSGVFFGLSAYGAAIAVIVVLDVLVIATIAAFRRHDTVAGWLLVPYLLWIGYATALNVAIWALN
jgi:translocator protein